jgi:hypothetical protein
MFSNRIANSARFLQMPIESQLLYFHMILRADDDGIVESYPLMRLLGLASDNFKILLAKGFIKQLNEDQVIVICDWLEHNTIRADRKVNSIYHHLLIENAPEIPFIEPKPRSDVENNSRRLGSGQSTGGISKVRLGKVKEDHDGDSAVLPDNPLPSSNNGKKRKKVSEEDSHLHKESQELIDYWKAKWQEGIGKEPSVTSWGRYIKQSKPLLKQFGLIRMKSLCDLYFSTFDDKFIESSNWSLNIFLMDSIINKLNSQLS